MPVTAETNRVIAGRRDLDHRYADAGHLLGLSELERQIIGEVEDGATQRAGVDRAWDVVAVDGRQADRIKFLTIDSDHTSTKSLLSHPRWSNSCSEFSAQSRSPMPLDRRAKLCLGRGSYPPLRHRARLCLSRLSSFPSLAGRRQTEHPDFPWSGCATTVPEAVAALEISSASKAGPQRRSRPRAPVGPSQPRRPGPLLPRKPSAERS